MIHWNEVHSIRIPEALNVLSNKKKVIIFRLKIYYVKYKSIITIYGEITLSKNCRVMKIHSKLKSLKLRHLRVSNAVFNFQTF